MKFYRIGIMLLILMGTFLQADETTKEPVCKSTVECDKLSHAIEVQIDELNKRISTSKGKEKIKLFREKQALEQQKTDVLLASKNTELKEEKAKQAAYAEVSKKLDIIDGSLK